MARLIQAWAGHKSFVPKDDDQANGDGGDFKGKQRSNDTHESKTNADARLYRKENTASELRYMGHTLSDNRHGLIANAVVTTADGHAEREAAKAMISDARQALGDVERVSLRRGLPLAFGLTHPIQPRGLIAVLHFYSYIQAHGTIQFHYAVP